MVYGPCMKRSVIFGNVSNSLNSAVKIPDSQAYKIYENETMTRDCFGFTFDPTGVLLSLQTGFHFVGDAVVCAILEKTSGFKP